jgi:hypothetical protein
MQNEEDDSEPEDSDEDVHGAGALTILCDAGYREVESAVV